MACLADGKWTVYSKENGALPHNDVRSLAITTSATGTAALRAGTLGGGLSRFENGRWTTFDSANSGLGDNGVRCLAADPRPEEHAFL